MRSCRLLPALALSLAVVATAGAATVTGTEVNERLVGTAYADRMNGRGGNDSLFGRAGQDRLIGGAGADRLVGGPARDEFNYGPRGRRGAAGNDRILARDGTQDLIDCGPGRDVAVVDRLEDGVFDCETIREPKP